MRFTVLAAAGLAAMLAQAAHPETLTIVITGMEETEGDIRLSLYDSEEAFDQGGEAAERRMQPVTGDEVTMVIDDIPAGHYAVKLYHDADSDGVLDSNMMGMPTERYGFSNNKGRIGPSPWAEAVFEVSKDENEISINLR